MVVERFPKQEVRKQPQENPRKVTLGLPCTNLFCSPGILLRQNGFGPGSSRPVDSVTWPRNIKGLRSEGEPPFHFMEAALPPARGPG